MCKRISKMKEHEPVYRPRYLRHKIDKFTNMSYDKQKILLEQNYLRNLSGILDSKPKYLMPAFNA